MAGSEVGQGQSRVTGFNARNLCPQITQFLPWFRSESSFTLSANLRPERLQQSA